MVQPQTMVQNNRTQEKKCQYLLVQSKHRSCFELLSEIYDRMGDDHSKESHRISKQMLTKGTGAIYAWMGKPSVKLLYHQCKTLVGCRKNSKKRQWWLNLEKQTQNQEALQPSKEGQVLNSKRSEDFRLSEKNFRANINRDEEKLQGIKMVWSKVTIPSPSRAP